jgi:hypothetical protein
MLLCNAARFPHPSTTTVKCLRNFLQQDVAPCYYASNVQRLLNDVFPDTWIGRAGPIAWLPSSPLLTPFDYFLLGRVKTILNPLKLHSLNDLKARITKANH